MSVPGEVKGARPRPSVREATAADAEAFAQFLDAAWREAGPDAPGFAGASEEAVAEITDPDAFRRRIGRPAGRMFLAWTEDGVAGFCATRRVTDNVVELSGVIVSPARAGMGIGTSLLEAAMRRARGDGYHEMIVKTETTNRRAAAFYEVRGFARMGVETEQVDDLAIDVVRLSRSL